MALQSTKKAHYALEKLTKSGRYKKVFDQPFFKEFVVQSDTDPEEISLTLRKNGIIGGYHLGKDYPQYENALLYAVTEKRNKTEIDKLSSVLEGI